MVFLNLNLDKICEELVVDEVIKILLILLRKYFLIEEENIKLSETNNPLIKIKIGTTGIELKFRTLLVFRIAEQC